MGQAAVDLPADSADKTPALTNADDLLAQLAGEEIDRLLADADPAFEAPPAGAEQDPSEIELKLQERLSERDEPASTDASAAATDQQLASEVDALFKELNVESSEQATSTEEKAALAPAEPAPVLPAAPAHAKPAAATPQEIPAIDVKQALQERVPVYVRILELVNAPFNACPDGLRDSLGKLAILTFMNAAGVLLYVMLFRH